MMLPPQNRAIVGTGKVGLARQPSGATIVIGRKRPEFVGTGSCVHSSSRIERSVTQTRDVDRADERHVDGEVDLRPGSRQVDGQLGAGDGDRDLDPQVAIALVGVADEAVEMADGAVDAVGQLLDLPPEHPLGVVHQVVATPP